MTELRRRMDEDMLARGFAERTRETYLWAVAGLARFYRRSPDCAASTTFAGRVASNRNVTSVLTSVETRWVKRHRLVPPFGEASEGRGNPPENSQRRSAEGAEAPTEITAR